MIQIIEIKIGGDSIIEPDEVPKLINKIAQTFSAEGSEPIVISGRLPVWVYAALTHWFHPRPWIATFEPRKNKGVVVASHSNDVKVGKMIDIVFGKGNLSEMSGILIHLLGLLVVLFGFYIMISRLFVGRKGK